MKRYTKLLGPRSENAEMKIKEYLYNNEKEETISLAYEKVKEIAKTLGIKLKPEKDFKDRMSYAYDAARRVRFGFSPGVSKLRDINSISVAVEAGVSPHWRDTSKYSLSSSVSRELTDPSVSDVSSIVPLLDYCSSVKIVVRINWHQAWRRQVRKKQLKSVTDLAGALSGKGTK